MVKKNYSWGKHQRGGEYCSQPGKSKELSAALGNWKVMEATHSIQNS